VTLTGYQIIKFNIDDKAYESAKVSYNMVLFQMSSLNSPNSAFASA